MLKLLSLTEEKKYVACATHKGKNRRKDLCITTKHLVNTHFYTNTSALNNNTQPKASEEVTNSCIYS
jgi:hypothetical protein